MMTDDNAVRRVSEVYPDWQDNGSANKVYLDPNGTHYLVPVEVWERRNTRPGGCSCSNQALRRGLASGWCNYCGFCGWELMNPSEDAPAATDTDG